MRKPLIFFAALLVTTPLDAATLAHARAESAKSFVTQLYSHYRYPGGDHWRDVRPWDPFEPATAASVFDPSTVTLLRDYGRAARAAGYSAEALDVDPFCDCQDSSEVGWSVSVRMTGAGSARAVVEGAATPIRVDLIRVNGAWRVHDVFDEGQSMRAAISSERRDLRTR